MMIEQNPLVAPNKFRNAWNNSRKISRNVCAIIELYMNFCIECAFVLIMESFSRSR